MKTMTGQDKRKNMEISIKGFSGNGDIANALNDFYLRFNHEFDFFSECRNLSEGLSEQADTSSFSVRASDVRTMFLKCNPRKSSGPDMKTGKLLKTCSDQLCKV